MEEFAEKFCDELSVETTPNSTLKAHPFQSQRFRVDCKHRDVSETQSNRRKKRLIEQKLFGLQISQIVIIKHLLFQLILVNYYLSYNCSHHGDELLNFKM